MAAQLPLESSFAVLKSVRSALLADATLSGLLVGDKVVAFGSAGHPTPYISMALHSDDWSTATEDGQQHQIDLSVWHQPASQSPDSGLSRTIMGHVRRILHTAALTIDAPFHVVLCRIENQIGPYIDPDGATLHGVLSARIIVDHT